MRTKIYKHLGGYDIDTGNGILTLGKYGDPYMFDENDHHPIGTEVGIDNVPKVVALNILKSVYWRIPRV